MRCPSICLLSGLFILLLLSSYAANASSSIVGIDDERGYTGRIVSKVVSKWEPPALRGNYTVQIKVSLDGEGRVKKCVPVERSSLEVFDQVACSAVYAAAPFGRTSYEAPLDVYLVFHLGEHDRKAMQELSDADAVRAEARARAKAEREMARSAASATEQNARERAEACARSQGKELPKVSAAPVAPAHRSVSDTKPSSKKDKQRDRRTKDDAQKERENRSASEPSQSLKETGKQAAPAIDTGKRKADAGRVASEEAALPKTKETAGTSQTPLYSYGESEKNAKKSAETTRNEAREQKYKALLKTNLDRVIFLPDKVPDGPYSLLVTVSLGRDGTIRDAWIHQSSGNEAADKATIRSIKLAKSVPAPPKSLGTTFTVPVTAQNRLRK
ncbi:MAG: TonB family protein [Desulfovibrio sp.]|nr:TonB family protein [Desulfovibrio sp.]